MQKYQEVSTNHKNNNFALDHLKGSIGQAVIETYLLEFGYDFYPYGYEKNYANITRFKRRDYSDATITKIRSMPDLLVYDKDHDETFLLQIKATTTKDESKYWISKSLFDSYRNYWSEALLIVYCVPTANIYWRKIEDIKDLTEGTLPKQSTPGYYLNLINFPKLATFFRHIQPDKYNELSGEIEGILKECSQISLQ